MPAHPSARHLSEPWPDDVTSFDTPLPGVVRLWFSLGPGAWLWEGCEVLASTPLGELLIRYRCSDDDRLYEGWVLQATVSTPLVGAHV